MFNHQKISNYVEAISVVDCAHVDLAIVDTPLVENWTIDEECATLAPATARCAIVDIAVADFAVVDNEFCGCSVTPWAAQKQTPYDMPRTVCEPTDVELSRWNRK